MNGYIKRSVWFVVALLGCLMLKLPAQAASFDCGKATTTVEKLICADTAISKLDEELAAAYNTALQNEKQAESIRQTQKKWTKARNGCQAADCLERAYIKRIHELADTLVQEVHYRYRLKESHDKELCTHMTQAFNQRFKTPWDESWVKLEPNPVLFGKPYDKIFERLPGIEYNNQFTGVMVLSKYPSSPEFEAVHWREGRADFNFYGSTPPVYRPSPILVTEIDIDNDGQKDWVVKDSFMIYKVTTWDEVRHGYGGTDRLKIFQYDEFDPMAALTNEQLFHGQKPACPPRMIDTQVTDNLHTMQLRPFVFKRNTYLSAYQVYWRMSKPEREYMNILRVTGGGKRLFNQVTETANTETVCRIRMIMLTNQTKRKGN